MKFIDLFCGIGGFRLGLERCNKSEATEERQASRNTEGYSPSIGGEYVEGATFNCVWSNANGEKTNIPKQENSRIKQISSLSTGQRNGRGIQSFYRCVWANDNDKYACQIYRKHWGNKELHEGDIRAVDPATIPEHDLICAGFPCQSFSIAGKRRSLEDAQGTLFFEICRIARAKRTPYLFLENVGGLLSASYVETYEALAPETREVVGTDKWGNKHTARRYTGRWTVVQKTRNIPGTGGWVFATILQALDELGYDVQWDILNSKAYVPQNRERVFIIGHLRGKSRPKVFPIGEANEMVNGQSTGRPTVQDKCSTAIHSRYNAGEQYISTAIDGNYYKGVDKHGQRTMIAEPCIKNVPHGFNDGFLKRYPNLRAAPSSEHNELLVNKGRIRRLTPIECERLQSFPDGWTEGISDTQRYKCLGNAVTVNVIEAIGVKL